ncbi:hypothetical protein [Mesorhizobium sp. BE184]|uniref:hypothetical protein n=1 Tax=Mesorhizobium sp. BE184 TaxID=2817714 RepID=UPI002865E6AD|nr:hypothetical protein [Mesorhizobium sp. BE184]MDR7034151.1 hypothetical protein [Mesorhizobium sp. BE184]
MTRPSDIKPREGDLPGSKFDDFEIGAKLPETRFTITPDIVAEYARAVESDPRGFEIDGKRAALPSVLFVYLMSVFYRRYPPAQGGIMAGNRMAFFSPIWADEDTDIVGTGQVEEKFTKKGRNYIRYSAVFHRADNGQKIAEAVNTSTFPN